MEIKLKESRGVAIVGISGRLIGGTADSEAFHRLFRSLLDQGRKAFVVDLLETPWANSFGIGTLTCVYASVTKAGGTLALANVRERIRDVLTVTKLSLVFAVFDTVEEAVERLAPKSVEGSVLRAAAPVNLVM